MNMFWELLEAVTNCKMVFLELNFDPVKKILKIRCHIWSLLKLQTSHRQVTDESQTSAEESQTTIEDYRLVTDDYRLVTNDYRLVTDDYRLVTDESQTTTDESQTSHRRLRRIIPEVFYEYINKTLFSERIWFPNAPMKRWFSLKKRKFKIWYLSKWWKLSYTRNQAILSF